TAAAATLASTSIPAMVRQGYEPKLAGGVVAISGTLAMIIPPSIALILYGVIADISISALFIGAIIPGVLVCLSIILTIAALVYLCSSAGPTGQSYSFNAKLNSRSRLGSVLIICIVVIRCLYSGLAPPTAASGVGGLVALLLALRERRRTLRAL